MSEEDTPIVDDFKVSDEEAEVIKDFVSSTRGEESSSDDGEDRPEPSVERDPLFDTSPASIMANMEGLPDMEGVIEITDLDKKSYIKAVLNEFPVILEIEMCGGGVQIETRARTSWEQGLAYEAAYQDQERKIVKEYMQGVIQLQKYSACMMIQSINGKKFNSKTYLKENNTDFQDQVKELKSFMYENIENMDSVKLSLILNAVRIFEFKIAKMSTQCLQENFWKPAD